jgi:hypothetical protein
VHFVGLTAGSYNCAIEVACIVDEHLPSQRPHPSAPGVSGAEVIPFLRTVKWWQPEYMRSKTSDTRN